jgi:hypothetical protein
MIQDPEELETEVIDKLGVLASAICAVHCMLTPVIALFSPVLSSYFESNLVHLIIFLIAVPLALFAFIVNKKKHGSNMPLILGLIGITCLSIGLVWAYFSHSSVHHHHHEVMISADLIFSFLGGAFLIIGHLQNMRLCRCRHKHKCVPEKA